MHDLEKQQKLQTDALRVIREAAKRAMASGNYAFGRVALHAIHDEANDALVGTEWEKVA